MGYVLAVDPGVNTGVVLLSTSAVAWAITCQAPFEELQSALRTYVDIPVVCERAPSVHRHEADTYDRVTTLVDTHPDVTYLTPSQWKGHPSSRLTSKDRQKLTTKHEKEAASLGRRFLAIRRTNECSPVDAIGGNP